MKYRTRVISAFFLLNLDINQAQALADAYEQGDQAEVGRLICKYVEATMTAKGVV